MMRMMLTLLMMLVGLSVMITMTDDSVAGPTDCLEPVDDERDRERQYVDYWRIAGPIDSERHFTSASAWHTPGR
uniref:Putative secreted protein n=1 Tax=Anopheles darlingi TaxID=43151 RepID=A0A2M4D4Y5_ANODA